MYRRSVDVPSGVRVAMFLVAAVAFAHLTALAQTGVPSEKAPVISVPSHVSAVRTLASDQDSQLPTLRYGLDLTAELVPIVLEPVDLEAIRAEDALQSGSPLRVGVERPVGLASTEGTAALREVPGIGSVWSVALVSPGAQGLRLQLSEMNLPAGAELWFYAPQAPQAAEGPHQGSGPLETGEFWSQVFPGEEVRVEYFLPEDSADAGSFLIAQVAHIYRGLEPPEELDGDGPRGGAGWCHNDVMCYPAWHPLHNATARIMFQAGATYLCSGTLLNTEAGDETPYFLTANHCISTNTVASTVTAYWFYQTVSCDGPNGNHEESNNSEVVYTRTDVDASLLMLRGTLPQGLTWAGWDTDGLDLGENVTAISHPAGDRKKITFGHKISGGSGNKYNISWTSGTIEEGSSGSGLYRDTNHALIGIGSTSTPPMGCENPDGPSQYGKFKVFYYYVSQLLEAGTDDGFEDNDTCAEARMLGTGVYTDLVVKHIDEDWYQIPLTHCQQVTVTMAHRHNWGDIDIELYDACGGNLVASNTGSTNNKVLSYTNAGDTHVYYLRVYVTDDPRNEYDLEVVIGEADAPPPPTYVTASDGDYCEYVYIVWNGSIYATGYTIWRNEVNDVNTAEQIGASELTLFSDYTAEHNVVYYYWVQAHNENPCGLSDFSEPDTGYRYCEVECPGDLDGDLDIDLADLSILLGNYGMTSGATYEDGDIDGDGDVDLADLGALLAVYGTEC